MTHLSQSALTSMNRCLNRIVVTSPNMCVLRILESLLLLWSRGICLLEALIPWPFLDRPEKTFLRYFTPDRKNQDPTSESPWASVPLIDNNSPAPRVHCLYVALAHRFFAIYWRPTVDSCKRILLFASILPLIHPTSKVHDMSDEKKPVRADGESIYHYTSASA
jgi:hypothetical protein